MMTSDEYNTLQSQRADLKDKKEYVKITTVLMLHDGFTPAQISLALGISKNVVKDIRQLYKRRGATAFLQAHYQGYAGKLSREQREVLIEELTGHLYRNSEAVVAYIDRTFGIRYSISGVTSLLKRLGFSYKKTERQNPRIDQEQEQAMHKELQELHALASPEEPLYCVDAVHPQHNTRPNYGWIRRGKRWGIVSNTGRKRININAALNAQEPTEVIAREETTVNSDAAITLFEELIAKNPQASKIHLICDNARYYRSKKVRQWNQENPTIIIHFLPPYCPHLNIIERLWKYLRKEVIDYQYYEKYQDFKIAIRDFFSSLEERERDLQRLLRWNFPLLATP